ncbi:MAG: alanine racemase [Actinomycetota bacterium]
MSADDAGARESSRWAWADIDLDALAHNLGVLSAAADGASVWAVVKADGYGHGAVEVADAVLAAGADGLCVALTREAVELRAAGIDAPILLLSQQPVDQAPTIVEYGLTPTVYTPEAVDAIADAAEAAPARPVDVHLKIDTGMQRVGAHVDDAFDLAVRILDRPGVRLAGVFTHLAVADSIDPEHRSFTAAQLDRFESLLARITETAAERGAVPPITHAANSAGTLAHRRARHSIVRAGIALYGISPGDDIDDLAAALRPAMELRARVSFVKRVRAGSRISYGLRHRFDADTTVATLPIGYADGVPRRLGTVGGEVLVGGHRCPIVGVVTMDQLMVDVGHVEEASGRSVALGDEAVLIGSQGSETVRAEEWARLLDTIGYEIVCGVSARIPRRYVGGPAGRSRA